MKKGFNLLIIIIIFIILVYFFQNKLIFFPKTLTIQPALPEIKDRDVKNVFFKALDGTQLHGVLITDPTKNPGDNPILLFSHGNAGHIGNRFARVSMLSTLPVDIFLYDYRGFGISSGTPSVSGAFSDASGALKYLTGTLKIPLSRIILYGESIGTGVSTWTSLSIQDKIGGMVLEAGFSSLSRMAGRRFPIIGPFILSSDMPSTDILKKYKGPLLVIHSRDDRVIPFSDGKALFESCPSSKKLFFLTEKYGHSDPVWEMQAYMDHWKQFLDLL